MAKTDVISAMEAIEGAALREKPRKKTPPLSQKEEERKKALIRWAKLDTLLAYFLPSFILLGDGLLCYWEVVGSVSGKWVAKLLGDRWFS
jgi:hypothetical protein